LAQPVAARRVDVAALFEALASNVERVIQGKRDQVHLALVCLFAEGHLLIEDVPGVGKTSLAKALARSIAGSANRIQFTPDLLPSDVIGVSVWNRATSQFEFRPGGVFAHVLLGDEINRASPKTQSALLEAMEERQVTVDAHTWALPRPFLVIATQNPVELEGTYPLPEAQLDRFLMRLPMGYPDRDAEMAILETHGAGFVGPDDLEPVATAADIAAAADAGDARASAALVATREGAIVVITCWKAANRSAWTPWGTDAATRRAIAVDPPPAGMSPIPVSTSPMYVSASGCTRAAASTSSVPPPSVRPRGATTTGTGAYRSALVTAWKRRTARSSSSHSPSSASMRRRARFAPALKSGASVPMTSPSQRSAASATARPSRSSVSRPMMLSLPWSSTPRIPSGSSTTLAEAFPGRSFERASRRAAGRSNAPGRTGSDVRAAARKLHVRPSRW